MKYNGNENVQEQEDSPHHVSDILNVTTIVMGGVIVIVISDVIVMDGVIVIVISDVIVMGHIKRKHSMTVNTYHYVGKIK